MKYEFFTLDFKDGRWPRFAQPTAEIALFIRPIEPCGQRRLDFEMTLVRFYWQEQAKIKLLY